MIQQKNKVTSALIVLIIANLYPLVGILFLNWNILNIFLIYWSEIGIVCLYSIFKIIYSKKDARISNIKNQTLIRLIACLQIIFGFGFMMFVELIFIVIFYLISQSRNQIWPSEIFRLFIPIILPVLLIFISHGYSFIKNYIINNERAYLSPVKIVNISFQRIAFMFCFIVVSMVLLIFMLIVFKNTVQIFYYLLAIIFVLLKIFWDSNKHIRERLSSVNN